MGWPNDDPEGWAGVEREAVRVWLEGELTQFGKKEHYWSWTLGEVIEMLQVEHNEVFQVLLGATPVTTLIGAEAGYLERKFSTGGKL